MLSSSDSTHASGDVSSSDSDNPRSSADCEGSSNLERDRAAAITLPVRTRRNAPRKPTHQPKGVYEVSEIDLKSHASKVEVQRGVSSPYLRWLWLGLLSLFQVVPLEVWVHPWG